LEKTKTDIEIKGLQEIIFNLVTTLIKFINYERETNTQLHCKMGKIAVDTLHTDLKKLSELLKQDGFELAIKLDNLSLYNNIPITECQFSITDILIKLKIPIRQHKSNWNLFKAITYQHILNSKIQHA